ncbi:MAG: hypothetical protein WB609_02480 [Candidatus Cybelea sp.]
MQQASQYPQIDALLASNRETTIETYAALAQRPDVYEQVIRKLHLGVSLWNFSQIVTVTPLTNTSILQYQVDWSNPRASVEIANELARAFITQERALAESEASDAAESLASALGRAGANLSLAQNELNEFESRHALADPLAETAGTLAAIADVQSKMREASAEQAQDQGQLSSLFEQIARLPATSGTQTFGAEPDRDPIQEQLAAQQVRLKQLQLQFTPDYPDIIDARHQIASLESQLRSNPPARTFSSTVAANPTTEQLRAQAATLQAQLAGRQHQLATLEAERLVLNRQLREAPASLSALADLQRRVKADQTIYDALQTSYFNAAVSANMSASELTIVALADPTLAEVRPRLSVSALVLAVVLFLCVLGLVGILDALERARFRRDPAKTAGYT